MRTRTLGSTGREVSEVGFGAWQIGADWGSVGEDEALATLHSAVDAGVSFFDTADVYGDGRADHGRDEDGAQARADRRQLLTGALPRLERPLAREPRDGDAAARPAALP